MFYLKDMISRAIDKHHEEILWYLYKNDRDLEAATEELHFNTNLNWYEAQWVVEEIDKDFPSFKEAMKNGL